jgi:hypothetical protein
MDEQEVKVIKQEGSNVFQIFNQEKVYFRNESITENILSTYCLFLERRSHFEAKEEGINSKQLGL